MESVDWNSCIICKKRDGDLRCPVDSHVGNGIEVYSNFLEAVEKFHKFDALPVDIKCEGENLAELLYQKWHKSCHLKFSLSKLIRVET